MMTADRNQSRWGKKPSTPWKFWLSICTAGLLLGFLKLTAQQTAIHGWVSIHNSGYHWGKIEYVSDAFLTAPLASPTRTDANGRFNLVFSGVSKNSKVEIHVEKSGFLVVNQRDLKDVTVGRMGPIHVFLATPEQLHQERLVLEKVSLEALTRRHDSLISSLREAGRRSEKIIQDLEGEIGETISNRFAAEEKLKVQFEKIKAQIPALAAKLARVNLDFASDLKKRAFNLFKAGKIDSVTIVLEAANLDSISRNLVEQFATNQQAQTSLDSGVALSRRSLDTLIATFGLAMNAYVNQGHLDSALICSRRQLHFQNKVQSPKRRVTHWQMANLHLQLFHGRKFDCHPYPKLLAPFQYGHHDSARYHIKAAITKEESLAAPDTLFFYTAYLKLAEDYFPEAFRHTVGSLLCQEYGFFKLSPDSALVYLQKAFQLNPNPQIVLAPVQIRCAIRIVELLEERSIQFQARGKVDAAIEALESAMVFSQTEKQTRRLARSVKILKRQLP